MKKILQILFLLSIGLFYTYCAKETKMPKGQLAFFDLKGYFNNQKAILSKFEKFKKTTFIDGKQVEKELDSIDFDAELMVFEQSDINKIAWMDKYLVDSIFNNNDRLNQIIYKATDDGLRTQQLQVTFNQNGVDTINIYNNSSSNVVKLEQRLQYIPSYGYFIESKQKTAISAEHVVTVEVQFLK